MDYKKVYLLICVCGFASLKAIAESIPSIYSVDNSYWIPKFETRFQYPPDAIRASVTGCVRVDFTIDSQGRAVEPYKIISIPDKVFEKTALDAIKKASFEPSATNTERVSVRSSLIYAFNINSRVKAEYYSLEECEKLTSK